MEVSTLTYNLGNLGFWMCSTGWFKLNCFRSHCSPIVGGNPLSGKNQKSSFWMPSCLIVPNLGDQRPARAVPASDQGTEKRGSLGWGNWRGQHYHNQPWQTALASQCGSKGSSFKWEARLVWIFFISIETVHHCVLWGNLILKVLGSRRHEVMSTKGRGKTPYDVRFHIPPWPR